MTGFLLLAIALLCCAFAVMIAIAETAFTYLPHAEAEEIAAKHPGTVAQRVLEQAVQGQSERYTHPLRLARVLAAGAATVATLLAFESWVSHPLALALTLVLLALVGYPLMHVMARSAGRNRAAVMIALFARPIALNATVLSPVTGALDALSARLTPNREVERAAGVFEEDELREFLERAEAAETIEDDEAQIVQSVFEMDDTRIRSVMVPRTDILSVEAGTGCEEALQIFLRSGFSRMPVIGESSDDILGVLYLKDTMRALVTSNARPDTPIEQLMRPARFEPESRPVMELLRQMQREASHVAIVVDEYGGTAGMITLEDLIEELVGDIADEYDQERPEYELLEDGSFRVSARLGIEELGEIFGIDLEDEEVDTVGGLMAKHLNRVPIVGSEVTVEGIHLRATGVGGRRHRVQTIIASVDRAEQPDELPGESTPGTQTDQEFSQETEPRA